MFWDTHCHLDFDVFDPDRSEVIRRAQDADVRAILNPAIDLQTSEKVIALAHAHPGTVYAMVGFHPNHISGPLSEGIARLEALAADPTVVAIGEIGLDYYRDYVTPTDQRAFFLAQLELAQRLNKPVAIHNRDASHDILPILSDWVRGLPSQSPLRQHPGDMHAYDGGTDQALQLAELNFVFGIGGPVTYKNAAEKREVVRGLPLEKIILETDAPFLTPHPHRGKRNEPAYIPLIAAEIGELHQKSRQEIGEITTATAAALFSLQLPGSSGNA